MTPTDPKTPSLRERIQSIVIEKFMGEKVSMLETTDAILLAIKEELPPKEPSPNLRVHIGWNSAIEEMERRLV